MNDAGTTHSLTPVAARPPLPAVAPERRPPLGDAAAAGNALRGNLNTLLDGRWLVAGVTASVAAVAVLYVMFATPVYEANLVVYVEEASPAASKNVLDEASALFDIKKAAVAEIELLRSRMVVLRALDNLQLYVEVRPRYFPVLGAWYAARHRAGLSTPGLFGHGGYVWGGERAEVAKFEVPASWQNRDFTLTARGHDRFRFSGANGFVAEGEVGSGYRFETPDGPLELEVARLEGRPGAQFLLRRNSPLAMAQAVQSELRITEQGKQSGIIQVKLAGEDPQRIHRVLSEIGKEYMRQDLARKTEEAQRSLAFLDAQLPALRRILDQAEERYNSFRNAHGTVDLQAEARASLGEAAAARARLNELGQQRTLLLARFTAEHPVVRALDRQRREVEQQLAQATRRIKELPALEQEEARLLRDIQINTGLYTALSKTAQQLRLVEAGRVSNVRLIDEPMAPERPVSPRGAVIVMLAAIIGAFLGVVAAFARKAVAGGIDEPQQLERLLGTGTVYATIPHSSAEARRGRKGGDEARPLPLLANAHPADAAVESLRGFRVALQHALPGFRNNIVMLTGATRGAGTSFACANLAAVLAAGGKRVLLIDADLRGGQLHRYFGGGREHGLSSAIHAHAPLKQIVRRAVLDNLDFIPTGALPPNPSECLLHRNLATLLESLAPKYDLVLIDTPPALAVADALVVAGHAGAAFLLSRAQVTRPDQIAEAVRRLARAGLPPQGLLLNDVAPGLGRSETGYGAAPRLRLGRTR